MHKIIIDPVTGKSHTVDGVNEVEQKASLEKQRRELRDMIGGNTKFHDDKPPEPEPPKEVYKEEWFGVGNWGYFPEET